MKFRIVLASVLIAAAQANAGVCVLTVDRHPCPGKSAESFAKCNGVNPCTETKSASSEELCAAEAVKACANSRFDITKYKMITAKYEGQTVENGKDFCAAKVDGVYDPETNFPYRSSTECN